MASLNDGRHWVAHDGAAMPIAFNRRVWIERRSGTVTGPHIAGDLRWHSWGGFAPTDIMFYTLDAEWVTGGWDVIDALMEAQGG